MSREVLLLSLIAVAPTKQVDTVERQKKVASELHELRQAGVALPQKYQAVLDREPQLQASMAKQPAHLKRLKDMVCELFVDMGKFKGGGARARVSQLSELLDNYKHVHTLIEFFKRP